MNSMMQQGLYTKSLKQLIKDAAKQYAERPCQGVNLLSFSGGKDSTAMYLLAHELDIPFQACFADTQWERPEVYEQVELVPRLCGREPIQTVRADIAPKLKKQSDNLTAKLTAEGASSECIKAEQDRLTPTHNAFVDLVKSKRQFPSPIKRFCTENLKILPIRDQVYQPIWDAGNAVVSWMGIRAAESYVRAMMPTHQNLVAQYRKKDGVVYAFRPLLNWTLDDVWAMHERHNVPRNKLYDLGAKRVGCWPCVMSGKAEIANVARVDPEKIKEIEKLEQMMRNNRKSDPTAASFFWKKIAPGGADDINEVVAWASKDIKDWRQHKLDLMAEIIDEELSKEEVAGWSSQTDTVKRTCDLFGACE